MKKIQKDYLFTYWCMMSRYLINNRMKWFYVCLHHAIATHELYFVYKHDNYGGMGLSTIQKVIVACRYFTYGMVAN
jgi:hypothetical protein